MADPTCAHCGANVLKSNWPQCCSHYGAPAVNDDDMDDLEPGHVWVHTAPVVDQDDLDTSRHVLNDLRQHQALFTAPYGVKSLRETLCIVEGLLYREHHFNDEDCSETAHVRTVKALIEQCDTHRPLGSNGKHGNLHTPTCGCDL